MKLTRESLKQLIRENFSKIIENEIPDETGNDIGLRWSRYMDNYKSDSRIRNATNACLAGSDSNELSELLTDILESIEDEAIRDRFLVVIPQMVEDRLKENN